MNNIQPSDAVGHHVTFARSSRQWVLGALIALGISVFSTISYADPLPTTPATATSTFHTLTEVYQAIAGEIGNLSSTTIATGTSAFGVDGTMYPGTTITTGQTACYDAAGSSIACAGTGQDGDTQAGLAFDYTDNGDGTVTDNNTGLTWQQGYSTSTMSWSAATTSCANNDAGLPGTGWRLPNAKELFTLVDFTVSGSAKIDLTTFPGTPASGFWSATTYPDSSNQNVAMVVYFISGSVFNGSKTNSYYVRCVQE